MEIVPDRQHFAGLCRRQQPDVGQRQHLSGRVRLRKQIAFKNRDCTALQPAKAVVACMLKAQPLMHQLLRTRRIDCEWENARKSANTRIIQEKM